MFVRAMRAMKILDGLKLLSGKVTCVILCAITKNNSGRGISEKSASLCLGLCLFCAVSKTGGTENQKQENKCSKETAKKFFGKSTHLIT